MITVVDYGLGNIGSIVNALDKFGEVYAVSGDPQKLWLSDALIFPGDGAAGQAMENLEHRELIEPIKDFISSDRPFLGICLGMQILLTYSAEGNVACLNEVSGIVKKFSDGLKVPQIGWNEVELKSEKLKVKSLFNKIPNKSYFYFINSFYCEPTDKSIIAANTDYGDNFCSVFVKDNITGVQFHPEKSGKIGLQFLKNYINNINYLK